MPIPIKIYILKNIFATYNDKLSVNNKNRKTKNLPEINKMKRRIIQRAIIVCVDKEFAVRILLASSREKLCHSTW